MVEEFLKVLDFVIFKREYPFYFNVLAVSWYS